MRKREGERRVKDEKARRAAARWGAPRKANVTGRRGRTRSVVARSQAWNAEARTGASYSAGGRAHVWTEGGAAPRRAEAGETATSQGGTALSLSLFTHTRARRTALTSTTSTASAAAASQDAALPMLRARDVFEGGCV